MNEKHLDKIITTFGFESEPTMYYIQEAEAHPETENEIFKSVMEWKFDEE